MKMNDAEILHEETPYRGDFSLFRYSLRHRLFLGGWSEAMDREIFDRGHAVAVVLYDPDQDLLVLIEQFRAGAFVAARQGRLPDDFSPWLIEIVAGIIKEGEQPEDVARREAMEEAGCAIRKLERLNWILASPGGSTETIIFYLGLTQAPPDGELHGLSDEHEDIRVLVAPPEEVYGWIDQGRVVNGPALVGLQWFRIHQDQLRTGPRESAAD
jgi:ADP-ribose pyrophosphatase